MATKNFDIIINQINEGLFDRAKANVAGMVGSAKGIGTRIAGAAQAVPAALTGNTQKLGNIGQKTAAAKQMGIDAKSQSIVGSHQQKLTKAINDYANDLSKMKLSDQKSIDQLKQNLTSQIQGAVRIPTTSAAATNTSSSNTASGVTGSTSTSSGTPLGTAATPATSSTPAAASTTSPSAPAPGAASPTTGTPAAATPTASASPTTPTTLANPDSVKAAETKLKDLANQEKILKSLSVTDKAKGPQYAAQLKSIDAEKQATLKQKLAAQAAMKLAAKPANVQDKIAQSKARSEQERSIKPNLTNASYKPAGFIFNELFNNLTNGLKPSSKYNLLS